MTTLRSTLDAGAVELALALPSGPLTAGSTVEGELTVGGGPGRIEPVDLALFASGPGGDTAGSASVTSYRLTDAMRIEGGEASTVPVTVAVPHRTPVSRGGTTVRLTAGVDPTAAGAAGGTIEVEPGPVQAAALDAISQLGFAVERTRVVPPTDDHGPAPGPVQPFECVPVDGPFERRLDRLDVAIRPDGREMAAYLDVHREGGLFGEVGGEDGRILRVAVEADFVERLREALSRQV